MNHLGRLETSARTLRSRAAAARAGGRARYRLRYGKHRDVHPRTRRPRARDRRCRSRRRLVSTGDLAERRAYSRVAEHPHLPCRARRGCGRARRRRDRRCPAGCRRVARETPRNAAVAGRATALPQDAGASPARTAGGGRRDRACAHVGRGGGTRSTELMRRERRARSREAREEGS